jgi:hypothetical protein
MLAISQLLLLLRAPARVPHSQACTHTAPGKGEKYVVGYWVLTNPITYQLKICILAL